MFRPTRGADSIVPIVPKHSRRPHAAVRGRASIVAKTARTRNPKVILMRAQGTYFTGNIVIGNSRQRLPFSALEGVSIIIRDINSSERKTRMLLRLTFYGSKASDRHHSTVCFQERKHLRNPRFVHRVFIYFSLPCIEVRMYAYQEDNILAWAEGLARSPKQQQRNKGQRKRGPSLSRPVNREPRRARGGSNVLATHPTRT